MRLGPIVVERRGACFYIQAGRLWFWVARDVRKYFGERNGLVRRLRFGRWLIDGGWR